VLLAAPTGSGTGTPRDGCAKTSMSNEPPTSCGR
jgi:hypothetical protein